MKPRHIVWNAFLDNISGVALFGKLRWPGAPTEMIDSRTVEEYLASGEFDESVEMYRTLVELLRANRIPMEHTGRAQAAGVYEEHALH